MEDNNENELDYAKLGFKAGLEIHQQLDSSKLFCHCPSLLRKDEPDFIVKRRLHAVAGESGEVDIAAKHEAEKAREFVYQGYKDSTCLVELDEEPPHEINQEALKIAVQIALLLNAKIMPITQIMRKTVIDGSNTSGFQRTVMLARDGFVETAMGRVRIEGIYLEEDAARHVKQEEGIAVYRLDRLGIPMIEVSTDASMKTPEQVKEVALHIGNVLRSCKVKRGIGTIRQDLNMSIKGGERVEIKGFQEPKMMVKTLNIEIKRQIELLNAGKEIKREVRNALADGRTEFLRPMPGSARMYPETDLPLLKISLGFINEAKKTLPKLRTEVREELEKQGLNEDMIKLLFKLDKVEEFKELVNVINNPQLVAKTLLIYPKEIAARKKLELSEVYARIEDELPNVFILVKKGEVSEQEIKDVLMSLADGKSLKEIVKKEKAEVSDVEEKIRNIIRAKPGLSENAYMGLVMKEFKGKVDGREAMGMIRRGGSNSNHSV